MIVISIYRTQDDDVDKESTTLYSMNRNFKGSIIYFVKFLSLAIIMTIVCKKQYFSPIDRIFQSKCSECS